MRHMTNQLNDVYSKTGYWGRLEILSVLYRVQMTEYLSDKLFKLFISMSFLYSAGCAPLTESERLLFNPAEVKSLSVVFEKSSIFLGRPLPVKQMQQQIQSNLSQWSYPFSDSSTEASSHSLAIEFGQIKRGSTPAGFSLTIGNSDPRALDFQQADVLTLSCSLFPTGQPDKRTHMTMEIIADDFKNFAQSQSHDDDWIEKLTDNFSTVCFNLLDSLNVKRTVPEKQTLSSPDWMPEIRIEIENEQPLKKESEQHESINQEPASESDNKPNQKSESNPIQTEIDKPKNSSNPFRKRIIIHNQGNPVIFEFGHERK